MAVCDMCNCWCGLQVAPRSLFLFGEHTFVRQACVWIITHRYFDSAILALIILNSVALAMADYSVGMIDNNMEPDPEKSWRNKVPTLVAPVFTALFTLEFVLKVVAMGFFLDKGSYLRDPWNTLDFLVVVSGLLDSLPGMPRISPLRVFRVMRPLRTIEFLPGAVPSPAFPCLVHAAASPQTPCTRPHLHLCLLHLPHPHDRVEAARVCTAELAAPARACCGPADVHFLLVRNPGPASLGWEHARALSHDRVSIATASGRG